MKEKLLKIKESAISEIEKSDGLERLNEVRQSILGKKGELTAVLKGMKDVAPEDRPKVGQWVNETREAIEKVLSEKLEKLEKEALRIRYEADEYVRKMTDYVATSKSELTEAEAELDAIVKGM